MYRIYWLSTGMLHLENKTKEERRELHKPGTLEIGDL